MRAAWRRLGVRLPMRLGATMKKLGRMATIGRAAILAGAVGLMLSTDLQAQATEWTRTVAPGIVRLDAELATRARDRDLPSGWGDKADTLAWGYTDLSHGLTERLEVRAGGQLWQRDTLDGVRSEGMGDLNLSFKWHLAGDEAEGPAWAVMPFVKLPTANGRFTDDTVDAGAMVIFGHPLGEDGWLNAQAGWEDLGDGAGGRDAGAFASAVAGRAVTERWTIYTETLATRYPWTGGPDSLTLDLGAGVVWAGNADWTWGLDLAAYAGLTRASTDAQATLRLWVEWGAGE